MTAPLYSYKHFSGFFGANWPTTILFHPDGDLNHPWNALRNSLLIYAVVIR